MKFVVYIDNDRFFLSISVHPVVDKILTDINLFFLSGEICKDKIIVKYQTEILRMGNKNYREP